MGEMRFRIEPDFLALFPEACIGVVVARGLDNRRGAAECAALLESEMKATAERLAGAEIGSLPEVAPWRLAYAAFGLKPSKFRSSLETLLRSALSGRLRSINPLVDLYNAVSLRHRLPCGGEDLATIDGDLRLTRAVGDEEFVPLGGTESEPPQPGVVIYRDDRGVICNAWNWREADRTKLTESTTDAFLCLESLAPQGEVALRAACEDLAALVTRHLGGKAVVDQIGGGGGEKVEIDLG
jgi:DNA/RNA-binding domain of Phe-tRNA-synthetase-like protein